MIGASARCSGGLANTPVGFGAARGAGRGVLAPVRCAASERVDTGGLYGFFVFGFARGARTGSIGGIAYPCAASDPGPEGVYGRALRCERRLIPNGRTRYPSAFSFRSVTRLISPS